jgi:hypothetical protein
MNTPESTTPPPTPENPLGGKPDLKTLFETLLRQPQALVARLAEPGHDATSRFTGLAFVSFLFFGLVLGCFAKNEQLWAAPAKITAGLLVSGLICFPSLYIFSTLAGARVSISQLAACLAGALALAGLLLLGFAPAVWIFAESTDSLGFMGTLGHRRVDDRRLLRAAVSQSRRPRNRRNPEWPAAHLERRFPARHPADDHLVAPHPRPLRCPPHPRKEILPPSLG